MLWQLIFPVWLSANDQVSVLQMRHRPGNSLESSQRMISATGLKNSDTLRKHQAGREQVEEIRCSNNDGSQKQGRDGRQTFSLS